MTAEGLFSQLTPDNIFKKSCQRREQSWLTDLRIAAGAVFIDRNESTLVSHCLSQRSIKLLLPDEAKLMIEFYQRSGVLCLPLNEELAKPNSAYGQHLRCLDLSELTSQDLVNLALFDSGVFVRLPESQSVPIQLKVLKMMWPVSSMARHVLWLDSQVHAEAIRQCATTTLRKDWQFHEHWDFVVGAGASLAYTSVQRFAESSSVTQSFRFHLSEASSLNCIQADFGAKRQELILDFEGTKRSFLRVRAILWAQKDHIAQGTCYYRQQVEESSLELWQVGAQSQWLTPAKVPPLPGCMFHFPNDSFCLRDQIFYFRSRGISLPIANFFVCRGQLQHIFDRLPMEFAVELDTHLQQLLLGEHPCPRSSAPIGSASST